MYYSPEVAVAPPCHTSVAAAELNAMMAFHWVHALLVAALAACVLPVASADAPAATGRPPYHHRRPGFARPQDISRTPDHRSRAGVLMAAAAASIGGLSLSAEAGAQEHTLLPADFGADPSGAKDSSAAFAAAVAQLLKFASGSQPDGLVDLGGATIDLDGGIYRLAGPIRIPQVSWSPDDRVACG